MDFLYSFLQDIKRQKIEAAETLKPEPPSDHPDAIRTVIKLPNGTRLERRFLNTDSLSVIRIRKKLVNFCAL